MGSFSGVEEIGLSRDQRAPAFGSQVKQPAPRGVSAFSMRSGVPKLEDGRSAGRLSRMSELLGLVPGAVGIELNHPEGDFGGIGTQVLLIDNPELIDNQR